MNRCLLHGQNVAKKLILQTIHNGSYIPESFSIKALHWNWKKRVVSCWPLLRITYTHSTVFISYLLKHVQFDKDLPTIIFRVLILWIYAFGTFDSSFCIVWNVLRIPKSSIELEPKCYSRIVVRMLIKVVNVNLFNFPFSRKPQKNLQL